MPYDGPNHARKESRVNNVAGAASASMTKFLYFARTRIKKVHALVNTAGTNTAAGIDIFNGTTSVGSLTVGTTTAGSTASSGLLDAVVESLSYLEIKGKANSGTMNLSMSVEEEVMPDAVFT
jgi:hypothetical protein